MSSSDELESLSSSESTCASTENESEEDLGAVGGPVEPYRFEPLAPEGYEEPREEEDEDGLTPAILESRFEKQIAVEVWCKCGLCRDTLLTSAMEYRCCKEITTIMGRLTFDGIAANCITSHPDFLALTNATVLEQVCPLLKDKQGKCYKFPTRGSHNAKNESRRATAYRFLVRWIFGSLGWDNTRPLPACIYHMMRTKFPTAAARGYSSAQQRQ